MGVDLRRPLDGRVQLVPHQQCPVLLIIHLTGQSALDGIRVHAPQHLVLLRNDPLVIEQLASVSCLARPKRSPLRPPRLGRRRLLAEVLPLPVAPGHPDHLRHRGRLLPHRPPRLGQEQPGLQPPRVCQHEIPDIPALRVLLLRGLVVVEGKHRAIGKLGAARGVGESVEFGQALEVRPCDTGEENQHFRVHLPDMPGHDVISPLENLISMLRQQLQRV
mmetsp:Transcript_15719/g.34658  ORF Transcript_15719/g.34658 Transcript_15719/m.34658 type:complete len:219 (+) Transcript_15719:315-971(+)